MTRLSGPRGAVAVLSVPPTVYLHATCTRREAPALGADAAAQVPSTAFCEGEGASSPAPCCQRSASSQRGPGAGVSSRFLGSDSKEGCFHPFASALGLSLWPWAFCGHSPRPQTFLPRSEGQGDPPGHGAPTGPHAVALARQRGQT